KRTRPAAGQCKTAQFLLGDPMSMPKGPIGSLKSEDHPWPEPSGSLRAAVANDQVAFFLALLRAGAAFLNPTRLTNACDDCSAVHALSHPDSDVARRRRGQ